VIKAAAGLIGLRGEGMIAEHSGPTFLNPQIEKRCLGVNRAERPD
jgi:hypothetical protein